MALVSCVVGAFSHIFCHAACSASRIKSFLEYAVFAPHAERGEGEELEVLVAGEGAASSVSSEGQSTPPQE